MVAGVAGVKVESRLAFSRRRVTSRGAPQLSRSTLSGKIEAAGDLGYSMRAGNELVRLRARRLVDEGGDERAEAAASELVGMGEGEGVGDRGDEKKVEKERLWRRACLSGRGSTDLVVSAGVRGEAASEGRLASARSEGSRSLDSLDRALCVRDKGCRQCRQGSARDLVV